MSVDIQMSVILKVTAACHHLSIWDSLSSGPHDGQNKVSNPPPAFQLLLLLFNLLFSARPTGLNITCRVLSLCIVRGTLMSFPLEGV